MLLIILLILLIIMIQYRKNIKLNVVTITGIILLLFIYHDIKYKNKINIRRSVSPEKRKSILIELYNMIIDASETTKTKPFLIYGTLLGYYRNKDLICYDYDLDFGIDSNEYKDITNYLIKNIDKYPEYKINIKHFLHYKTIEIFHKETLVSADICSFTLKNNMYSRDIPKLYAKYYLKEDCVYMDKEWITPLKTDRFLNRDCYIPNIPENLLKCYYGNDFIVPDHICNEDCTICNLKNN